MKKHPIKTTHITLGLCIAFAITTYAENDCKKHKQHFPTKRILKKFDKDGDGKLNAEEKAAFKEERKKRKAKVKAKITQRFDTDGDGELNQEEQKNAHETMKKERKEIRAAVFKQFDTNGNGQIDKEERKGIRKWIKANYPDAIHPWKMHQKNHLRKFRNKQSND